MRQHAARRLYALAVAHERTSVTYRPIYTASIVMTVQRVLVLVGNSDIGIRGQLGLGGGG